MKLKATIDGGSRGNPGLSAIGVVIRDESGKTVFSKGKPIGYATNNEAEWEALILLLTTVSEMDNIESLSIKSDSKLVVEVFSGKWRAKNSRMVDLLGEAKQIANVMAIPINLTYFPRRFNHEADFLVNQALDSLA